MHFVGTTAPSPGPSEVASDDIRSQLNKLSSLFRGIRSLHAKMQIIREESHTALGQKSTAKSLQASLSVQYESIGADLKNLLQEWEDGKSSLTTSLDKQPNGDHSSHSSMSLRSPPLSPVFSLGGLTAVEGEPIDALKTLNSEIKASPRASKFVDDEEVFEAQAVPRHRKRASLTRDERISRVREERARKVAARDRVDTSTDRVDPGTTVLKELEMVIKQRPRARTASTRVTSI